MDKTSLPIGVFDSGVGGLTVLQALKKKLPNESFIYLGDTARLPYGTKSLATVKQYAVQMAAVLVARQVKALVIACNTATTAALPYLQDLLPDLPVIGVVNPSAAAVIAATKNQQIMLLATETTIASAVYQRLISEQLPAAAIKARACSVLVALAEEGMANNSIAREALLHYLSGLAEEDTLLLGCTHFPVFKQLLRTLLPAAVTIIDSAEVTAAAVECLLQDKKLLSSAKTIPTIRFLVTDSKQRFITSGKLFLHEEIAANHVELIDVPASSSQLLSQLNSQNLPYPELVEN